MKTLVLNTVVQRLSILSSVVNTALFAVGLASGLQSGSSATTVVYLTIGTVFYIVSLLAIIKSLKIFLSIYLAFTAISIMLDSVPSQWSLFDNVDPSDTASGHWQRPVFIFSRLVGLALQFGYYATLAFYAMPVVSFPQARIARETIEIAQLPPYSVLLYTVQPPHYSADGVEEACEGDAPRSVASVN